MKPAGATAYSDLISFIFENDMMWSMYLDSQWRTWEFHNITFLANTPNVAIFRCLFYWGSDQELFKVQTHVNSTVTSRFCCCQGYKVLTRAREEHVANRSKRSWLSTLSVHVDALWLMWHLKRFALNFSFTVKKVDLGKYFWQWGFWSVKYLICLDL